MSTTPPPTPNPPLAPASAQPAGGVEARLAALGLTLPAPVAPVAAYVPTRRVGNLLYVSGQVPIVAGQVTARGRVPREVSVEAAQAAARQCVLNALAAAKAALGSLDAVVSVVRVGVWVACEDGFAEQPKVANGASELLVSVFGEAGRHARAAVGTNALPLGVAVEVEVLLEVR